MNILKIMVSIGLIMCYTSTYAYNLENLNWKGNMKNYCSSNIQKAIGLSWSPGNATDWTKYGDKETKDIIIGDVIVISRHNKALKGHKYGWLYGHIAIALDIDKEKGRVLMYDGPRSYKFWTNISNIDAVISEEKMKELGAKNIR